MKLKITFLIICALFLGTVTGFGQVIISGREIPIEGTDLKWIYTANDSTLTVRGTGDIPDYDYNGSPWHGIVSLNIAKIVIEDGVTRIGRNAFNNCNNLTSVNFTASVKSIGVSAFGGCSKLLSIDLKEVEIIES